MFLRRQLSRIISGIGKQHWFWHGAAADSWFSHLAIEVAGENTSSEWCEPVDPAEYAALG